MSYDRLEKINFELYTRKSLRYKKELNEYHLLTLIRILFKENRNKELGFYFFQFYQKMFHKNRIEKNLADIGLAISDFKKYKEMDQDKEKLKEILNQGG